MLNKYTRPSALDWINTGDLKVYIGWFGSGVTPLQAWQWTVPARTLNLLCCLLLFISTAGFNCRAHNRNTLIFAAASLEPVLSTIIEEYNTSLGSGPRRSSDRGPVAASFAATSTLARQLEAGAPARLFFAAHPRWIEYLNARNLLLADRSIVLLRNQLVVVAPLDASESTHMISDQWATIPVFPRAASAQIGTNGAIGRTGIGDTPDPLAGKRVCLADPEHVPAGIYAAQALDHLGYTGWRANQPVYAADVRANLYYIEQGVCDLGFIYKTDALSSKRVRILYRVLEGVHDPIEYVLAATHAATASDLAFYEYLQTIESARVFESYGFTFAAAP